MDSNGSNWMVKYSVLSQSVSVNIFFKSKFQTDFYVQNSRPQRIYEKFYFKINAFSLN